ncbi:FXSXX-COOH protein [Streptomyces sp. MUSC 14]|uniref:FxSxx-COOH cyclophane-containing RiPP peptide n=1 Tax=Streptomyces sp. MUSC 14 TaxID=1354889 RepID=UPI0008F59F7B|nr:FxSxx-COOH cyclophane-containing RiPP peptide [Streptomyces sp. MUSC 14]OIJ89263.1 FXSXX-COOH protein [Streptomyces sp. MUSC 14]
MGARDEKPPPEDAGPVPDLPLPDLLALDLEELRTVEHPVLKEVLAGLRERAERPSEMLWGFTNCL